jgi:membrane protein implicated in regulation of membrane protease activity
MARDQNNIVNKRRERACDNRPVLVDRAEGFRLDLLIVSWWGWLLLGLILFILEATIGGSFFLLFFGVSAVLIGLLELLGVHLTFVMQGLAFVAIAVLSMMLLRRPLLKRFQHHMPPGKVDNLVGEVAKALQEIGVNDIGPAELRGASWSARNIGNAPIAQSARCRVERVEGLTLQVRGES